jgi:hypothetical protein
MPWCPDCDRWLAPSTVHADGTCPRCGVAVDPGRAKRVEALPPVPWSLKVLAGAAALYLGFRALQGVAWVVERVS